MKFVCLECVMLLTKSWHKELFATIASPETQASLVPDNLSPRFTPTPSGISLYPSAALREKPLGGGVEPW